ncbi:MAG TPA: PAS domain S-box protein [Xanthomonadaceae bacterium]
MPEAVESAGPSRSLTRLPGLPEDEEQIAHFAAIVASSDDAIVSKTLDGVIRSWNEGAERIFGYSADEIVGQPITTIIPLELGDEERMILGKIRSGERIEHYETERVAKDGRRIPVSLSVSPIRNEQGQVVGASKIARDISERRLADALDVQNQRLMWAEAQGLSILNECSSSLWSCTSFDEGMQCILDTMIRLMRADMGNVQLRDGPVLRIAAQRGFDQEFLEFFHEVEETDECACGRAWRNRRATIIADVETDQAYAPFRETARRAGFRAVVSTPLMGRNQEVLGVVSVQFRDAHEPADSDLRRMELCASNASHFLQRFRMEQQLRDSDRRKDEFLAMLAHELRNPLAPICSGVQLLTLKQADAGMRERTIGMLQRQSSHLVRLVDDLLDVSRIGRGKIELRKEPLDLATVLSRAVETSRPLIESAGHRIAMDLPSTSIKVEADNIRLTQIFVNLLNNAAKYTPRGGNIAVAVELHESQVDVSVTDDGIGIAPDMLEHVFEMFTQVDQSLEKAQGGLGIGLSLVQALVALHGGTVQAFSEGAGRGSRFVVRLPVAAIARG